MLMSCIQDPYPERSIESLDLIEAMMLWLLRWGQKQNVAAEQKVVTQRQQAAAQHHATSAARASEAQPDTPTSPNGFTASEAHPQVRSIITAVFVDTLDVLLLRC